MALNVKKYKAAFTFIELLLVIAIIAVAVAVGVPTVWQNTGKRADTNIIRAVADDIKFCRSMALMDMPAFADAQFVIDKNFYKIATQTKMLGGNYLIGNTLSFAFDENGAISAPVSVIIKRSGNAVGYIDVATTGAVIWGLY